MNQKKVPHLFLATGASKWNDPKDFPWTMGFNPNYQSEGKLYAQHILATKPNAKIAVLYQNDDYGKDYLKGFMDGLGDKGKGMVVKTVTYEVTGPDGRLADRHAAGLGRRRSSTSPRRSSRAGDPQGGRHRLEAGALPEPGVGQRRLGAQAAGLDKSVGLISMQYIKDPTDPKWANDAAMKEYFAFMKKYLPATTRWTAAPPTAWRVRS
jgi:branched-chain amino acid transport system substrate-binding protein